MGKKAPVILLILLMSSPANAQLLQNLRSARVFVSGDTLLVDSLSIVPGSVIVKAPDGSLVQDSLYRTDHASGTIILKHPVGADSLEVIYRVLPYNFSKPYFHKTTSDFLIPYDREGAGTRFIPGQDDKTGFFGTDQMESRGSLSRGISVGNNQDATFSSDLNLQLQGRLGENLNILAAITDKNIPIQPDGYSQQIQDFDRVYIQLYNERTSVIFGDFETRLPEQGYFLRGYKKHQGGMISHSLAGRGETTYTGTVGGAVAKGRYARNQFTAREGNQGPYRLKGAENENVIIILAGSEKVYIDGQLQTRGEENDYVMDYNLAELSFTTRQPMTKDKRIVVEFEYSEKSYARFSAFQSSLLKHEQGSVWLNVYTEQDSKNQPVLQDLNPSQRQLLAMVGDSLHLAVIPNVAEVEYNSGQLLYLKKDTLVDQVLYTDIYVHSNNPDSARYRVGFSYVGENGGSYRPVRSEANGKVFQWIAPAGGVKQGSYEPVARLVAPGKSQMLSLGAVQQIGRGTRGGVELAISNHDLNTFSDLDQSDNTGFALKADIEQDFFSCDSADSQLRAGFSYQLVNRDFRALERFRPVEFERDWNLPATGQGTEEHLLALSLRYKVTDASLLYQAEHLSRPALYGGSRQFLDSEYSQGGLNFRLSGSFLNSSTPGHESTFFRHSSSLAYDMGKFRIGLREMAEKNRWKRAETDSLLLSSFAFREFGFFMESTDLAENRYSLKFNHRTDMIPVGNKLEKATAANEITLDIGLLGSSIHQLGTGITFRQLNVMLRELTGQENMESLLGRIQYSLRMLKGGISSSNTFETSSGQEPKRSYSYLEVPAGQGVYRWSDYNNNAVKELDEFDIAAFQDEANYIRILLPSNESVRVQNLLFNHVLNIQPGRFLRGGSRISRLLSGFSDNMAYRLVEKNTADNTFSHLNPFRKTESESTRISLARTFRNTLSWKNPGLGVDYLFLRQENLTFLMNGTEGRDLLSHNCNLKWKLNPSLVWISQMESAEKTFSSEYFPSRNYRVGSLTGITGIEFQPGIHYGFSISYQYREKENFSGNERSESHKAGLVFNRQSTDRTKISLQFDYLRMRYNALLATALAYEMLDGLFPGNNYLWGVTYFHRLVSGIELSANYQGRKNDSRTAGDQGIIHTGSIQARAVF